MDQQTFETKKLEYQMAQEMLRHYDILNWHIGSILIAAVIILTGLVVRKEIIDLARESRQIGVVIMLGTPLFSFFVLRVWLLWFRRHRDLYNFRNEVLYRLEAQLGMYHFLRVVEANLPSVSDDASVSFENAWRNAKKKAEHTANQMPILAPYQNKLAGPSGYALGKALAVGIPAAQFLLLSSLFWL